MPCLRALTACWSRAAIRANAITPAAITWHRRRLVLMHRMLEYLGIHPDRFRMSWVSASEGKKWAEVVTEVTEAVKVLGPNDIKREQVWMQQSL